MFIFSGLLSTYMLAWWPMIMSLPKLDFFINWAATWQNQQNDCAPSEDSDQPGHPPGLIRVFAVHSMGTLRQQRLWSDQADAQADLSLRCAHTHFVRFVMRWLSCLGSVWGIMIDCLSWSFMAQSTLLRSCWVLFTYSHCSWADL